MGLLDRRRQLAEDLLGTTLPAGPQMEPEVGFWQGWAENAGDRLGLLGSLLDPMTWYRAVGNLPPPDSPEAKKLFRRQGEGLLDVAMDWGVNPLAGGALGIFKGINANLADDELRMLQKAYELEQSGASREAIRQATNPPGGSGGWFRAPWDQKWRMEVDDSAARFNTQHGMSGSFAPPEEEFLMEVLDHPGLYRSYPKAVGIDYEDSTMLSGTNAWHPGRNSISIAGRRNETGRSPALHEVQHYIQDTEGFARGGSPSLGLGMNLPENWRTAEQQAAVLARNIKGWRGRYDKVLAEEIASYPDDIVNRAEELAKTASREELNSLAGNADFEAYRRLAGEAEARLVQARRDLTPQQRALLDPIEQMDTMLKQEGFAGGMDDLIVRYGDGPAMSAPKMTRKLADEMAGKDPRLDDIRAAMRDLDAREQALWDRYAAPEPGGQGLLSGARWDAVQAQERARQAVMGSEDYADIFGSRNALSNRMAKERKKIAEELYRSNADGPAMSIPDELPSWAPPERMAQWRKARENAALPVEQGGLGLGPANTAAERAKAGGYEGGWVHGTGGDFAEFSKDKAKLANITPTNTYDAEKAHFLTRNTETAGEYADEAAKQRRYATFSEFYSAPKNVQEKVISLAEKNGITNQYDFRVMMERLHDEAPQDEVGRQIASLLNIDPARPVIMPLMARGDYAVKDYAGQPWKEFATADALRSAEAEGKSGLLMQNVIDSLSGTQTGDSLAVFNPANIRSRFAAFDPLRRDEADLLASWLLPLVAGGGLLGGYFAQPQAD